MALLKCTVRFLKPLCNRVLSVVQIGQYHYIPLIILEFNFQYPKSALNICKILGIAVYCRPSKKRELWTIIKYRTT